MTHRAAAISVIVTEQIRKAERGGAAFAVPDGDIAFLFLVLHMFRAFSLGCLMMEMRLHLVVRFGHKKPCCAMSGQNYTLAYTLANAGVVCAHSSRYRHSQSPCSKVRGI